MVLVLHPKWVGFNTRVSYVWQVYFLLKGWNDYNHFDNNITEKLVQQTVDLIISTGLAAAGYEYSLFLNSFSNDFLCIFLASQFG